MFVWHSCLYIWLLYPALKSKNGKSKQFFIALWEDFPSLENSLKCSHFSVLVQQFSAVSRSYYSSFNQFIPNFFYILLCNWRSLFLFCFSPSNFCSYSRQSFFFALWQELLVFMLFFIYFTHGSSDYNFSIYKTASYCSRD